MTFAWRKYLGLSSAILALACAQAIQEPAARAPAPAPPAGDRASSGEPLLDEIPPDLRDDEPSADRSREESPGSSAGARRATPPAASSFTPDHPLDDLSSAEIEALVKDDPTGLGSLSLGLPNSGRLFNGVQLPDGELFKLVAPGSAYGTQETVDYLVAAARKVHERFPGTPPLHVGHLSGRSGGYLSPHLSHQSGRDVDLGFYYKNGQRWYLRATESNLDVARTWALVRAFITESDVEMILLDHSVQRLLKRHALEHGEDPDWVEGLFVSRRGQPALIRHVKGHATHLHVRFYNPLAQRGAQVAYPHLVAHQLIPPVVSYVNHVAKKGDSLNKLARIYGTTVQAIQRANGMKKTLIFAKRTYRIPRTGGPPAVGGKLSFPARRLPPFDPSERVSLSP